MPHLGSPEENREISNQQIVNMLMLVISVWAISIEVFIRRNFGRRYIDFQAVLVIILVPMYSLFWRRDDPRFLTWFLGAYLLMCFRHRIAVLIRRRDREPVHSYYSGEPVFHKLHSKCDEAQFKLWYEPLLVGGIGLVLTAINKPLGVYVLLAAMCLWLLAALGKYVRAMRTMDLQDQMYEQQWQAEQFRQP